MKVVLTIGASDSSGQAGIQADLRIFQALGMPGATAVTAVEARGAGQARRRLKLPGRMIEAQIDAVARDLEVGAVKIGPLFAWQSVETVAGRLRRRQLRNVVLQPGILDADGARVLGARGVAAVRARLLSRARVVVLSAAAAGLLAEMAVESVEDVKGAIARLRATGVQAVLITGLLGPALGLEPEGAAPELDCGGSEAGSAAAGVLSAAIAARLALGDGVAEAVAFAARFVAEHASGAGW